MASDFRNSVEIGALGQRTLPAAAYWDPSVFEAEQACIFSSQWLCTVRCEAVRLPGQFCVLSIGRESVILVRDQQGELQAYFNVCRHRGTRLIQEASGKLSRSIQCPYHAWTYDLRGQLVGVPDEKAICDFDRTQHGLYRVALAEWEGFIWLNLAPNPDSFHDVFAPVATKFLAWNLPQLKEYTRKDYEIRANWKLIVQNYSECYHCAPVHPALVKLSSPMSGGNDLTEGKFLGGYMEIDRPGGSLTMSGRSCGVSVGDLSTVDRQRVYYYVLFPNTFFSLHHDYVMVHTLWPQSVDRTRIECRWLFHPDTLESLSWNPEDGVSLWDQTNREDWQVSELTQMGTASSRYRPGPYSDREAMSAAFDRTYLEAMTQSDVLSKLLAT